MQKGDVTWSAELRFHGEYGVESQILRNGELTIGRRFLLKEQAIGGLKPNAQHTLAERWKNWSE